ncbi:hypothetical protein [Variovorax sp. J31P207]|nr:hypothetical protein [Variovorax sp. J31P207]MDM0067083.1 hypothetical protein [Variovorax sp. J31P207]
MGVAQVFALFHERLAVAPDDVLNLRQKPSSAHLFEAANGVRTDNS